MRLRAFLVVLAVTSLAGMSPLAAAHPRAATAAVGSAASTPVLTDVQAYGDATIHGTTSTVTGNQRVVGVIGTVTGKGYWEAATDGGVFAFGDAHFYGSAGAIKLRSPVVGIAATPTGKGYWLAAADGGVFAFGDAHFHGSMGAVALAAPVTGINADHTGKGYWLVATDGGVFTFGDAHFAGSLGGTGRVIVAMAARPQGDGYWLVDTNGAVYRFGHAARPATSAATNLTRPAAAIATTPSGNGFWVAGCGRVPVYFIRNEKVGAATRDVGGSGSYASVAAALVAGPTATELAAGLSSAVPSGTRVNGVTVSGDVATIDLSARYVSGGGSLSMQERVAQVVFTLTGLPHVSRVSFSIDGKHVTTIGGEGVVVDPLPGRASFALFEPQVLVTTPAPGDVVASPLLVTSEINAWEGVATFDLYAADGRLLAHGVGHGAMGMWVTAVVPLGFSPGDSPTGTLVARPTQGREGLAPPDAVIPLRFRP